MQTVTLGYTSHVQSRICQFNVKFCLAPKSNFYSDFITGYEYCFSRDYTFILVIYIYSSSCTCRHTRLTGEIDQIHTSRSLSDAYDKTHDSHDNKDKN